MLQIILISSTIIVSLPAYIGAEQNVTERIINSWDADDWRFLHVVAIINRFGPSDKVQCGGSLLTRNIVLTACHCILNNDTKKYYRTHDLYAMAGVHNFIAEKGKQVREFREKNAFIVHRNCNLTLPVGYDVGLGFLDKPFELTTTVRLVKFISTDDHTLWYWLNEFQKRDKICHIMGWGVKNYTTQHMPTQLQHGRVTLITQKNCTLYTCVIFKQCDDIVTKRKLICTIPYEKSMTCTGDSGGPLMCNEYIFGIVNSGKKDCHVSNYVPSFYCDPLTVLEFIRYYVPDYQTIPFPTRQDPLSVVAPFKYPFVVSIANVSNKYIPKSICAGSILTKSAVITTCECALKLEGSFSRITRKYENVSVVSGITKPFEDSLYKQQLNIVRVEFGRVCGTQGMGVGIVFLQEEFPFATRLVQPLKMLSDDAVIVRKLIKTLQRSGKKCLLATWGYVIEKPTEIKYNVFKEWEVRLRRPNGCGIRQYCSAPLNVCTEIEYNNETLCGDAYDKGILCEGDSGGPLMCEGYFMGVVMFNGDLCNRNNSIIITSLLGLIDFVKEVIPDYRVRHIVNYSTGTWISSPSGPLRCIVFLLIPFLWQFVFP